MVRHPGNWQRGDDDITLAMKSETVFQIDTTESFPHLPGAPIVEAVIHWQARPGAAISQDQWREQLSARLPDYPHCEPQQQIQVGAHFAPDGSSSEIRRDAWHGFRLTSPDKRSIAQFTRDGLAVSRLEPYENWEAFSSEAMRLWKIFVEIAEPREVERLGVRFINRIASVEMSNIGRYLSARPKPMERSGLPLKGFLFQTTHEVPGHPFQVNLIQALQPPVLPSAGEFGLILDIDVFTTQAFAPGDVALEEHLSKMRWLKNKVFFSLMSKRAITGFQKGKE